MNLQATVYTGATYNYWNTGNPKTMDIDLDDDTVADIQISIGFTSTLGGNTSTGGSGGTRWVMTDVNDTLSYSFDSIALTQVYNSDVTVNSLSLGYHSSFGLWGGGGNAPSSQWVNDSIDFAGTTYSANSVQHNIFDTTAAAISATDTVTFTYVSSDADSGSGSLELYRVGAEFSIDYDQVPEPSANLLLTISSLGLLARRRRP